MSQQRNNSTVVRPYKDRYGRYQFKIILFIVLVFIACIILLIGSVEEKGLFWKRVTIFFSEWWWIFVAIILIFFFFLFRKKENTKKININNILKVLFAALVFYAAYVYCPELRFWESKATTEKFSRIYGRLNTGDSANVFQNSDHRLQYTIFYEDQSAGYDFIPKENEWVVVRYEKYDDVTVTWKVAYGWRNGELIVKELSPPPSNKALAGECLVSIVESSNGYPATLYVKKY